MFKDEQLTEIVDLLSTLDEKKTKIYLGCDSVKHKIKGVWHATYATVMIVHKDGSKGCRIFSALSTERDYDTSKNRPALRLMTEVYKVTDLYLQLYPLIDQFDIEVHLDVNPDKEFGSSCVATQAAGYVLGMTGLEPKLKPDSWAASFGADGIGRGYQNRTVGTKPSRRLKSTG